VIYRAWRLGCRCLREMRRVRLCHRLLIRLGDPGICSVSGSDTRCISIQSVSGSDTRCLARDETHENCPRNTLGPPGKNAREMTAVRHGSGLSMTSRAEVGEFRCLLVLSSQSIGPL
jgi:hypothetical protein